MEDFHLGCIRLVLSCWGDIVIFQPVYLSGIIPLSVLRWGQVWYGPLVKLRPLRWYDRIKTGPSPEDDALLQLTREIAVRLDSRFWYRQIVWGRFVRGGVGWMITMPVISREFWLGPLGIPLAELMFPEYLKGKLSLDEWRILIEMHLLRLKAFNSGRMSRLLGMMGLMILGRLRLSSSSSTFLSKDHGARFSFSQPWAPRSCYLCSGSGDR